MCNSNKRKCNTCVINVDLTINIKCLRLDTAVVNNASGGWLAKKHFIIMYGIV